MHIITLPTPTLRDRSKEIERDFLLLPETQAFIEELIAEMYRDDGVGIAAPQVGNNIRLCVVGKEVLPKNFSLPGVAEYKKQDFVLVNPQWEKTNKKLAWDTEGCLSVPQIFGKVQRYTHISVKAWDRLGNAHSFPANAFFARVIQHEVDHLDGILFVDKAKDIYHYDKKKDIATPLV